ncbi:MAG TPA: LemA family protein [Candidatus Limnocylindrales bacterium]|nr:LemA family protein [Candidatus Limnocylindrales bacterium]
MVIILIVLGVLVVGVIAMYNGLVRANVRTDEAWSDITVQLKRRADLIPNLVNTVKGYAAHEKGVFERVTEARSSMLNAGSPAQAAAAENQFQQAMKSIFAVAEAYPELKANQNFADLQAELSDTEDKIQASRRFYNGSARDLNTKIKVFPTSIIASLFGFKTREFFEVDEAENANIQKPTEVKF